MTHDTVHKMKSKVASKRANVEIIDKEQLRIEIEESTERKIAEIRMQVRKGLSERTARFG